MGHTIYASPTKHCLNSLVVFYTQEYTVPPWYFVSTVGLAVSGILLRSSISHHLPN